MDYSRATFQGAKYIPLETAQKESELPLPDLKRAISLGFIMTAEIGNTLFVERSSLERYGAGGKNRETKIEDVFSDPVTSELRKQEGFFTDEDNQSDTRENIVFREALERDKTVVSLISPRPYVSVITVAVIALILALPVSNMQNVSDPTALAVFSRKDMKKATRDEIYAFFNYTSTRSETVTRGLSVVSTPSATSETNASVFSNQQASAIDVWLSSTSAALAKLALGVYHNVNILLGIK